MARKRNAPSTNKTPASTDPVPAPPPKPKRKTQRGASSMPDPNTELLADAIRKIGRLCEILTENPSLTAQAAPTVEPAAEPAATSPSRPAGPLANAVPLATFKMNVVDLTPDEQLEVINVAQSLLERVYVHLPLKKAMHAIDPIRRLIILKQRFRELTTRGFHDEMIRIFHSLRDLHTNYILPESYQGQTAFLPFRIEPYFEDGSTASRYVVSALVSDFVAPPNFGIGTEVTHWNGIPLVRAVELNAEREAGSNLDAQLARGLESLTVRPMGYTAPPDEEWVEIGYIANGQPASHRFVWQVFLPPPPLTGAVLGEAPFALASVIGVDARTEAIRRAQKTLFHHEAIESARVVGHATGAARQLAARRGIQGASLVEHLAGPTDVSLMPDVFYFRTVPGLQGPLGYIRITTFMVEDADEFVAEFVRIARLLPQTGLIIDVRGNGGGNILAGERLLQVLTPHRIEPARLQFINTQTILDLAKTSNPEMQLTRWGTSIELGMETGDIYSQGLPIDPTDACNLVGQQYQGPVVLIVDALCYSTTDIFAAGFQDHQIGKVLGVHRHTGAGGANVWDLPLLNRLLPNDFPMLPKGVSLRVAIRRTTRVKERAGLPVEDVGVIPDVPPHRMTLDDVLHDNRDLIAAAAKLLEESKVRSLHGDFVPGQQGTLQITASNVTRVDVYNENGQPLGSSAVHNDTATVSLWTIPTGAGRLQLRGFDQDELVVVGWVSL